MKNKNFEVLKRPRLLTFLLALLIAWPIFESRAYAVTSQDLTESVSEAEAMTPTQAVPSTDQQEALTFTKPQPATPAATSTDFLMQTTALKKTEADPGLLSNTAPAAQLAAPGLEAQTLQLPLEMITILDEGTAPLPMPAEAQKPDDVAMLVSEFCTGGDAEGATVCDRAYSNGHRATIVMQKMAEGDEAKLQSIVEEYDGQGGLVFKKTVRHRTDYNYYKDEKSLEREFVDIIYQPAEGKTTRELMVRQYHLDTGKTRSLTWTQYEQIGASDKARLVYNATLAYDSNGTPARGLAERWDQGQKVATYIDWDAATQGRMMFDKENWREWESWIQSISLHAYLT